MTKNDLDRISRSWVGHIATNPAVRDKMNDVLANGDDEDMADLINRTVVPKDNVAPADVPAIKVKVNGMLLARDRIDPAHSTVTQHTTTPPGG